MDLDCVPVHNHAKINNLGQYPAILPSQLVSNPYIYTNSRLDLPGLANHVIRPKTTLLVTSLGEEIYSCSTTGANCNYIELLPQ